MRRRGGVKDREKTMKNQQIRVTFEPSGRTVYVLSGTKILEAAGRAGLAIQTPCGGAGTCGKCCVRITTPATEPNDEERAIFDESDLAAGWRLACQSAITSESVVTIPEGSLFAGKHQIFTEAAGVSEVLPAIQKKYVALSEPSLTDDDADLLRLEKAIGRFKLDLTLLRRIPGLLRENDFSGTAVMTDHRLIDFEPGDTASQCYGLAFDIGTTTIVGSLLDLCTGRELAIDSCVNPQVSYGDDVLARIKRGASNPDGLEELRGSIVEAINEMTASLAAKANIQTNRIYEIALAGNTTMEHLLCGVDPTQLGEVPFAAAYARGLMLPATELGLRIHGSGCAYVFPVIGGFVGGDTVAGLISTQLDEQDGPTLMVDIGTNGEIVLAHNGELFAASAAAGPAFEGARISSGMRGAAGAIEKVVFGDDDLNVSVIGDAEPVGLCGSGLIDLAAGLLDTGIVEPVGRMLNPDELPDSIPEAIRNRVTLDDNGQPQFILLKNERTIVLKQRDIRELQLATGAIRAGINILLRQVNLECKDLQKVLIAGGFGSFIRRNHAQRIGLLPSEIDHQRVQYVGNASLNGARLALLSQNLRKGGEQLARRTQHVPLSTDPNFQMEFAEAMIFPEA